MKLSVSQRLILKALEWHGSMTIPEICEQTGLNYNSLYNVSPNIVKQLNNAKLIHVCDWKRAEGKGGLPKAVYALGEGEDVPNPGAKPLEEKYAISRNYNRFRRLQKQANERSILSLLLRNPFNRGKK